MNFVFNNMIMWPDGHIFFPPFIQLPQAKQKTECYCFFYNQILFSFGNSVNVDFRGDLQYSLSISFTTTIQKL